MIKIFIAEKNQMLSFAASEFLHGSLFFLASEFHQNTFKSAVDIEDYRKL